VQERVFVQSRHWRLATPGAVARAEQRRDAQLSRAAFAAATGGGQWMAFGRCGLSSHRSTPSLSGSPHRRPPP
jgi:hypothetical protein